MLYQKPGLHEEGKVDAGNCSQCENTVTADVDALEGKTCPVSSSSVNIHLRRPRPSLLSSKPLTPYIPYRQGSALSPYVIALTISDVPSQMPDTVESVECEWHGKNELCRALQPYWHVVNKLNEVGGFENGVHAVEEISN
jgi:hypothetical protein